MRLQHHATLQGIVKEYASALAAIIAGLFAIISPFITWRLKNASDERARSISLSKERREELKRLFSDIFTMFEQAIGHARRNEPFLLSPEQSQINAQVRLLALGKDHRAVFQSCGSA